LGGCRPHPEGEAQARKGGELIAAADIQIDRAFTSVLTRAIRTLWLALTAAGQVYIPETKDWRLNERHYGGLTGLNKTETAAKHGADQVKVWRRSYDIPPPPMAAESEFDFSRDRRYAGAVLPVTESLKTTLERVEPIGAPKSLRSWRRAKPSWWPPTAIPCGPSSSCSMALPTTPLSVWKFPRATPWSSIWTPA